MIWVLVGVRDCVAVDAGHDLVTLLFLSGRLRTNRCISHRGKSQILLSRAHTCVWALGRLVALLSRIRLFPDRLSRFYFDGGGPCTTLSPELRDRDLES